MKPLSLVILCLFAMAPFLILSNIRADGLARALELRAHYDGAIDNAVADATWVLANASVDEEGYASGHGLKVETDQALEMFFDSLSSGLGAYGDVLAEGRVRRHVPVLVMADRFGAVLYVLTPHEDDDGFLHYRHMRMPPMPYVWEPEEGGHTVCFSMGTHIQVLSHETGLILEGPWEDWQEELPGLETEAVFRQRKRDAIAETVRGLLESGLMLANLETTQIPDVAEGWRGLGLDDQGLTPAFGGVTWEILLPHSEDAAFRRAVEDVGLFAAVQGLPVGLDKMYHTFAFGAGRVTRRDHLIGYHWEGALLYCREDCSAWQHRQAIVTENTSVPWHWFSTAQEAASAGYSPCRICQPH